MGSGQGRRSAFNPSSAGKGWRGHGPPARNCVMEEHGVCVCEGVCVQGCVWRTEVGVWGECVRARVHVREYREVVYKGVGVLFMRKL